MKENKLKKEEIKKDTEKEMKKSYLLTGLKAGDSDLAIVMKKDDYLLECMCEKTEDHYILTFHSDHMHPFRDSFELEHSEKLKLLINTLNLEHLVRRLRFSLNPDNLFFSDSYMPKVMERSVREGQDSFLAELKALIAAVMYPGYSYQDYLEGGDDLYDQSELLTEVREAEATGEIRELLYQALEAENEYQRKVFVKTSRKSLELKQKLVPLLTVLMVLAILLASYLGLVKCKEQSIFLKANEEFQRGNYVNVIEELGPVDVDSLSMETKYIAALSYVYSSNLRTEQVSIITSNLSMNCDPSMLDYWVYIGRAKYDDAIDVAKSLRNDSMLLYALGEKKRSVSNDSDITGSEKEKIIESIDEEIKKTNESVNQ